MEHIQRNFSIAATLIYIFGHFLLQYRGFPLSEVKNALRTPAGTKRFVLIVYCAITEASIFYVLFLRAN